MAFDKLRLGLDTAALQRTIDHTHQRLLNCRNQAGYWDAPAVGNAPTLSSLDLTCRAIHALAAGGKITAASEIESLRNVILEQQEKKPNAQGQGWGTPEIGTNSHATATALLALRELGPIESPVAQAAAAGLHWLLRQQDSDGGLPLLPPRGWWPQRHPVRSSAVAATAMRAGLAWLDLAPPDHAPRLRQFCGGCLTFLAAHQRQDGGWAETTDVKTGPNASDFTATAAVLRALEDAATLAPQDAGIKRLHKGGVHFLTTRQQEDGTWTDLHLAPLTATALAVAALANHLHDLGLATGPTVQSALTRGVHWLLTHTQEGTEFAPPSDAATISATLEAVGRVQMLNSE